MFQLSRNVTVWTQLCCPKYVTGEGAGSRTHYCGMAEMWLWWVGSVRDPLERRPISWPLSGTDTALCTARLRGSSCARRGAACGARASSEQVSLQPRLAEA